MIGAVGILVFPLFAQDYETDKTYQFISNDKTYETRRFSFGTIGSIDTRYTFETYRQFKYLPIETMIDKTDFFDTRTNLKVNEDGLEIMVLAKGSNQEILFKDQKGNIYLKLLD